YPRLKSRFPYIINWVIFHNPFGSFFITHLGHFSVKGLPTMPKGKIVEMVEGTADPAFAIDASGRISAWNVAAEELFGLTSAGARGRACHEILQGTDEGGVVYSEHYAIEQAIETTRPLATFDLKLQTEMESRRW